MRMSESGRVQITRIEATESTGIAAAYTDSDPIDGKLRFDVVDNLGVLTYGVYIKYSTPPSAAHEADLGNLGLPAKAYLYIPYIRSKATGAQIQQILALPDVVRVESIPVMYATNEIGTKTMQAQHSDYEFFPTTLRDQGISGKGVVVAILDTGVNDEAMVGGHDGHESLKGKFLGGGTFWSGQPELNTGLDESENPEDRAPDGSHGTHVAGTAIGTGGPTGVVTDGNYGFYRGVAPDARLVDCKVLSDAGTGLGAADGLEWCIYNRTNDWGLTGDDAIYRGIQVVNMSLGGSDASDGQDASSAMVNAAVKAGLIVLVASGNDGNTNYISSPAAADDAITVGASIDYNTLDRDDDDVADFSNEGMRTDDGDSDLLDEYKPSVLGPGAGITSAEGLFTASGESYVTFSGTSMATPMTAGVAALIVQSCPGISPEEVRRILQETADHRTTGGKQPASSVDPRGLDPNYHPSWGWGNVNAYAAVMEARYPNRTQVIKERGEAVVGGIDIHWTTQREVDLAFFNVLRADPIYGQPGAFQAANASPIAPAGDPVLALDDNRTQYTFSDTDPSLQAGETYWYRLQWMDAQGILHEEPAFPVVFDPPTPIATLEWKITHNTPDNDLLVFLGSGVDTSDLPGSANYFISGPGSGAADASVSVPGEATTGNIRHEWSLVLTDRHFGAAQVLPPSGENPWFLSVREGGFVNRTGRIEDFKVTVHAPGGDVVYTPVTPFPVPTVETQTTTVWIPSDPALAANRAPVLDPIGDLEHQEGQTLTFTVTASDPDGDGITLSAPELPAGATFDAGTGVFSWSPDHNTVASTTVFPATFQVDDDNVLDPLSDSEQIEIRLHDVDPATNLPPVWAAINDQSGIADTELAFKVLAHDPENQPLFYAMTSGPSGATFDPATRCFEWTPDELDLGTHVVWFAVTDGANPPVAEQVLVTVKGSIPPLLGDCSVVSESRNGVSSIGSTDLGTADVDTVMVNAPHPIVRMTGTLAWPGASDLDLTIYDGNGNAVGGSASLSNPETFLIDNLAAGDYLFVVEGYLVLAEESWTLDVDLCMEFPVVPVLLADFSAEPRAEGVRLVWSTSLASDDATFHVERRVGEEAPVRLTTSPLSGGPRFEFVDTGSVALRGKVAEYALIASHQGREEQVGSWKVDLAEVGPSRIFLAQSYPNPVPRGKDTVIRFHLPHRAGVSLKLYNVRGELVQTLVDGPMDAGVRTAHWNGRDHNGASVARGIYFYRLEVPGQHIQTKRLVVR